MSCDSVILDKFYIYNGRVIVTYVKLAKICNIPRLFVPLLMCIQLFVWLQGTKEHPKDACQKG